MFYNIFTEATVCQRMVCARTMRATQRQVSSLAQALKNVGVHTDLQGQAYTQRCPAVEPIEFAAPSCQRGTLLRPTSLSHPTDAKFHDLAPVGTHVQLKPR